MVRAWSEFLPIAGRALALRLIHLLQRMRLEFCRKSGFGVALPARG